MVSQSILQPSALFPLSLHVGDLNTRSVNILDPPAFKFSHCASAFKIQKIENLPLSKHAFIVEKEIE